jgi:hypothetical protein
MADLDYLESLSEQLKEGVGLLEGTRGNVDVVHVEVVGAAAVEIAVEACFGLFECHD